MVCYKNNCLIATSCYSTSVWIKLHLLGTLCFCKSLLRTLGNDKNYGPSKAKCGQKNFVVGLVSGMYFCRTTLADQSKNATCLTLSGTLEPWAVPRNHQLVCPTIFVDKTYRPYHTQSRSECWAKILGRLGSIEFAWKIIRNEESNWAVWPQIPFFPLISLQISECQDQFVEASISLFSLQNRFWENFHHPSTNNPPKKNNHL